MCQCNLLSRIVLNIGSIVIIIFYFFKIKRFDNEIPINNENAVFYSNGMGLDILPRSLKERYKDIIITKEISPKILDSVGRKLIRELLVRYPFSYYFIAKNLMKVSIYSKIINDERCGTVICSCEYSYTSSILTYYCNCKGVKHINIMHGEKLFFIRDSFFHFNVFYIWDDHYKELFTKLRASIDVYKVEVPESFIFYEDCKRIKNKIDYKYYLQAETEDTLQKIYEILLLLKERGKKVSVRTHPIYSNDNKINSIFKNIQIEDSKKVNIEDSILESKNIISLYSTVLFKAYVNNKKIIIDDCTNVYAYNALKDLNYIMIEKDIMKLSDILND